MNIENFWIEIFILNIWIKQQKIWKNLRLTKNDQCAIKRDVKWKKIRRNKWYTNNELQNQNSNRIRAIPSKVSWY